MLSVMVALAAETAEEHSSPTLFYVVGSLAAAWAVVLFALGMRSETFPATRGAQRGVMAISVLLVGAAMAAAVLSG